MTPIWRPLSGLGWDGNGQPIKSLRKAWSSACEAAGCPGKLLHDFRRTAVRNLDRSGVARTAAMKMVGHKTEAIYRRYSIVDSRVLKEAAAKIDAAMATGTKKGQSPALGRVTQFGRRKTRKIS